MNKLKKICKSTWQSILNLLFAPIFGIHRLFVEAKRPERKIEAVELLALINSSQGDIMAEEHFQRLAHLMEHYQISYEQLGLVDHNDLRNRVTIALARAPKMFLIAERIDRADAAAHDEALGESPSKRFLRELSVPDGVLKQTPEPDPSVPKIC